MTRLVVEVMLDREIRIYADVDADITVIDWQEASKENEERY
jgi:hypothetical protein